MLQRLNHRPGHYALLLAAAAVLFFPNLGGPSLWDIDEGNNAEAAREMMEAGDLIVPTFNYEIRPDKPALLYWLQIGAYRLFGVGEFAARLPSALAALAAVLLTYEFGRRLFGPPAGLLAGLVLASSVLFCASAHFANPDSLLNAFTVLTLLVFWGSFARGGRGWFVPAGLSTGFAVLAKGPVGLVLPSAATLLFLILSRRWRLLLDRRLAWGVLAFCLVALPWYIWVGAETKAGWLRDFFWTHNVNRYLSAMEGHRGPVYYHVLSFLAGFAPWSIFLGFLLCPRLLIRAADTPHADDPQRDGRRFLWCWVAVYFVFFSISGTKLPNYILPVYPPMALLTADFLDRWRLGEVRPAAWAINLSLACLLLMGVGIGLGFVVAGGAVDLPFLRGRRLPGLETWAVLGSVFILGAVAAWWCARREYRGGLVASVAAAAVLFAGPLLAWGSITLDGHKAPRSLVRAFQVAQTEPEVRVGCYQYFQPSLVFYCRREVTRMMSEKEALEFLQYPLPVYLFLPASVWHELEGKVRGPHRLLGRHDDLYRGCEVVVVTNAAAL
jgi:4-amino-4-deoxy-L-arabinose transferase-like glycosyltransferase